MRKKKLPKAEARREAHLRRRIFAAKGAWQEALEALRLHLPLAPQLLPLGATVNGCAKATQWRWAQELFGVPETVRLQHSLVLCNSVLSACRDGRDARASWPRGLQLLQAARRMALRPDVVSHSTALLGCSENWPWSLQLLELAEANQIGFNSALTALRSDAWDMASELLQNMQQCSHLPDVFAFTIAIGFNTDSDTCWRQGMEMMEMLMEESQVKPNSATLNSLIETCERSCEWPLTLWLLHGHQLPRATAVTYSAAMMTCIQGSLWTLALQLLEEMRQVGLQRDLVALGSGLAAAEMGREWRTGLDILQQLFLTEVLPSQMVYGSAVACCQSQWAWALQLLGHMESLRPRLRPDLVTMTSALLSLAAAAQWQRAMELLRHGGCAVNFLSFYAVLSACEDRHEHLQVLRLFPSIHDITMDTFREESGGRLSVRSPARRAVRNAAI